MDKTKQDIYENYSVLVVTTARVDLEKPMVTMCNQGFAASSLAGLMQILGVDIPVYHVSFNTKFICFNHIIYEPRHEISNNLTL